VTGPDRELLLIKSERKMFKVGDSIVYPMHGVGIVEAIEKKVVLGKRTEFYLIKIINSGMKVMIPVKNAEEIGVRGIIPKKDVPKVVEVLTRQNVPQEEDWKLRYQNNIEKVKTGSIYQVSEVARDLYRRGCEKELSIMERKLYENAYQLITHELALVKKVDVEEAGNFVSEALSTHKKGE
jgi:CarD family transcriptional regulator